MLDLEIGRNAAYLEDVDHLAQLGHIRQVLALLCRFSQRVPESVLRLPAVGHFDLPTFLILKQNLHDLILLFKVHDVVENITDRVLLLPHHAVPPSSRILDHELYHFIISDLKRQMFAEIWVALRIISGNLRLLPLAPYLDNNLPILCWEIVPRLKF